MIVITSPSRKRRAGSITSDDNLSSPDHRSLVVYKDPPLQEHFHNNPANDQTLCTCQCRQMVNSEFPDAWGGVEKQLHFQSRVEALNEELHKCVEELAAAKGREIALQEQLMKEVIDFQERLAKQMKSSSELELKLKQEVDLRKNAESSAVLANEKTHLFEQKFSHLSDSIEREKKLLDSELTLLKKESQLSVSRISADLERMECRASSAEKESEVLREQLEDLGKHLNERNGMEKKQLNFSSQFQEVIPAESSILVRRLQEDLKNYEFGVQETRKFKSFHEKNNLLKLKLLEEKGRREQAESELIKLKEVLLGVKELKDELITCKSMIKDIAGVSCYDDISERSADLHHEMPENIAKLGEVSARLKQIEVALEAVEFNQQHAEAEAKLAKEKAEESISDVYGNDMNQTFDIEQEKEQSSGEDAIVDTTTPFTTDMVFSGQESLATWCKEVGRRSGVVVIIKKSDSGESGRKARISLCCERSGYFIDHKKKTDSMSMQSKPTRRTGTKTCGCPFLLKGVKLSTGNDWKVEVICGNHNHPLAKSLEGHSYVGKLTAEEENSMREMSKSGMKPREILRVLKTNFPSNASTIATVYNYRSKHRLLELEAESAN